MNSAADPPPEHFWTPGGPGRASFYAGASPAYLAHHKPNIYNLDVPYDARLAPYVSRDAPVVRDLAWVRELGVDWCKAWHVRYCGLAVLLQLGREWAAASGKQVQCRFAPPYVTLRHQEGGSESVNYIDFDADLLAELKRLGPEARAGLKCVYYMYPNAEWEALGVTQL